MAGFARLTKLAEAAKSAMLQDQKPCVIMIGVNSEDVSPWKGVVRFGKRRKLNPRYVGPFKVLEKSFDGKEFIVRQDSCYRENHRDHWIRSQTVKAKRYPTRHVSINSREVPEFTWEREDQFQRLYRFSSLNPYIRSCVALSLENKAF
ncbi:hypothetical protein Tco_1102597 [Tanacetum coccineum]